MDRALNTSMHRLSQRLYSTIGSTTRQSTIQPRRSPSYRDLFRTPVFKSLFLTLAFGSVVVESSRRRKDIEALRAAYEAKFRVLREVTEKVRNKEPVDVAHELSIANALTRNKYNSVTDVELDDQFEQFLKMADDESLDLVPETAHKPAEPAPERKTGSFL